MNEPKLSLPEIACSAGCVTVAEFCELAGWPRSTLEGWVIRGVHSDRLRVISFGVKVLKQELKKVNNDNT